MEGALELEIGGRRATLALAPGVHCDLGDAPLYAPLARLVRGGERVLDLGCGHGALGIVAGLAGAGAVTFVDVDPRAVELSLANAARNGLGAGHGGARCAVAGAVGDLTAPVAGATFDLVLCNPPQTGGPAALGARHPARYGGDDGADHLVRLAAEATLVAPAAGARVAFLQLSRANPRRVAGAFAAAGYVLDERAAQVRTFTLDELDALAPGTGAHQLALRARGAAEFEGPAPDGRGACTMRQSLWVALRRAAR